PVKTRQNHVQGDGRVRQGAAGHTAVDRDLGTLHVHLHGNDAAQRVGDAGQADLDVLGVANDDHVRLDALLVLLEEADEIGRADLFLPLHQHLDVDGQAALSLEERGDGTELGSDGTLVDGGPAAIEPASTRGQ